MCRGHCRTDQVQNNQLECLQTDGILQCFFSSFHYEGIYFGTVRIRGCVNAEMDQLLDVDGVEECTVYLIAFGHGTD